MIPYNCVTLNINFNSVLRRPFTCRSSFIVLSKTTDSAVTWYAYRDMQPETRVRICLLFILYYCSTVQCIAEEVAEKLGFINRDKELYSRHFFRVKASSGQGFRWSYCSYLSAIPGTHLSRPKMRESGPSKEMELSRVRLPKWVKLLESLSIVNNYARTRDLRTLQLNILLF